MQHSTRLIVESLIIGSILIGVVAGGTLAAQSLPSGWKLSLVPPNSQPQQFNSTLLALQYDIILSEINSNEFTNASLKLSTLSFINYPGNLQPLAMAAVNQLSTLDNSLPIAGSDLSLAVDLMAAGKLANSTIAVDSGCSQALLANSSSYDFENITTVQLFSLGVPTPLYTMNLEMVRARAVSLAQQCQILSRELGSQFSINSNEDCLTSRGTLFCLALSSPDKTAKVGGLLAVQGKLQENSTGIAGDMIIFYLNGTYIGSSTTLTDGAYFADLTLPYLYTTIAMIWAVALQNSSIGFPIALGSNAIFIQLEYNSTHIVLGPESFRVHGNEEFFLRPQSLETGSYIMPILNAINRETGHDF